MIKILERYKYLIITIILFILYNSFFINKALHIDDPFTISFARAVNSNFFQPLKVFFSNPIFMGYYYAPIIRIFKEKEFWLHLFYLPFSLLAIISMFFLSLRFANKSFIPVLFLISSSAFIVTSQSIMLDIPLLGFFLAATATFIYGIDKEDNRLLVLSGLLSGIAILTKYSALMLIPILFVYALLHFKMRKAKFLLIPALIFILWNTHNFLFYKRALFFFALIGKLQVYFLNNIWTRIFAALSFLSGTSIIIILLFPLLLGKKNYRLCLIFAFVIGLCPFLIKGIFSDYSFFERLFLAVLFISSSYIIFLVLKIAIASLSRRSDKDAIFLSFWFFLIFSFNILTNFIAARFILLQLPPLFLLIHKELFPNNEAVLKHKIQLFSAILISFIFSTILAIGDYQFSDVYRDFIKSAERKLHLSEAFYFLPGIYYSSWGYAYYLEKYHYYLNLNFKESLDRIDRIKQRLTHQDVFFIAPSEPVLPIIIEKHFYSSFLDYDRVLVDSITYKGNIILHNRRFHAGFYSHDWGLLPFYISIHKLPLETFQIYRLSYSSAKTFNRT